MCREVERRSELAQQITRPQTRSAMEEWFGRPDIPDVWANIGRMHNVIRDPARTVTFVNAVGKVIGTNDHEYGRAESKSLIVDGRALKNADNYGYFLLSVD